MSTDSAVSIACGALKNLVVPIKRPFEYVMSSKSYAQDLQVAVGWLEYEAERVNSLMEVARNNLRNLHFQVVEWWKSAQKVLKEAEHLLDDFEKASKTCCYGTLPDPNCRYQFSRKAKDKIEVIRQLAQNCSQFKDLNDISSSVAAPGNVAAPTPARGEGKVAVQSATMMASTCSASTSTQLWDHDVFKSRELIMQEIMAALADNKNSVVGIYGMGGVGKSTVLVDVEGRIRKEKSFDWVIKAAVSEIQDIKRIQGEIAYALGLDIKDVEYVNSRAERLHRRLEAEEKAKRKVLIILDNLWERLDLKLVGIPCGYDNKVIGCKLLLTSRDRDVLRREMGCDKDFRLNELKEEEAKRLFERLVGDKVHDEPLRSLVDEALLKCAGLPFLIISMAKFFKHADFSEWNDVLRQIEMSTNGVIAQKINEMLQMSYNRFEGEDSTEVNSLLRLCVVYGVSKPSLENLLRYSVGLKLFREDSNMEEVRDRFSSLIRILKSTSLLLEDQEDADGFKIHNLVCEFVASVASRDDPLLVWKDNNKSVTELPKDKLKSCTAVCFPYVEMEELPEELDCPEMRIFLLFTNNESLKVPDSYFNSMRKLRVLHLSRITLVRSPSPFQLLMNLHTLCLDGCSLEDVAMIGELKGLHILSFVESNIRRLPKEIGQLVELRLLDLNNCSRLEIIEPGVLGSLIKLEELYMENSFDRWNVVDQTPPTNANLIELNNMKNLYILHLSTLDPSVLPEDLNVEKLTKYRIQMGDVRSRRSHKGLSTLELKLDPTSDILQKGCIQTFLGKTDDLFLDGLNGIEQSICALSQEGFAKLKHLDVQNSPSIHYVLQSTSHTDFKMLESLLLKNLINLEKICHSHIPSQSFITLKVVRVESCDKMEVLFPLSLMREFPQLEEIRAIDCYLMQEIIEADDFGMVELRNLHVLELRDLPNINNFFTAGMAPSSSTLDSKVGTQVPFFNGPQVSIPFLESLTMAGLPNLTDIWSNESPFGMSNLQYLEIEECELLSKVINSGSLVKLHKLHTLTIARCISVHEIFGLDGPCFSGNVERLYELTTLCLNQLPSLRRIWSKSPCGIARFHNLKQLSVFGCNNLEFMFFPSMVKSLIQLRELTIQDCKKMEVIIMEEEQLGMGTSEILAFPRLTYLRFEYLESLTCFSRGKCLQEAQSQDCVKSHSTALFNGEVSIPSLESLTMEGLPNLKEIWSNESPLELSNLRSLKVEQCKSLLKVFGSRSLVKLHKLHTLYIRDCNSVQEIFDLDGPRASGDVETLSELSTLELEKLQSLRRIWNKNPSGIVSFPNLKKLEVGDCPNLEFIYFRSMVKSLAQLRDLKVQCCEKMEAIIMEEEGLGLEISEEISETLAFPMLTNLNLNWLESLMCLSRGKCSREARNLDRIQSSSAALFNLEVAFPKLETLEIIGLDNLGFMFSPSMVKSPTQLKKLTVSNCKKMEAIVVEEEGLVMEAAEILAFSMLTDLHLKNLESLTCFFHGKCSQEGWSQDCVKSRSIALFNEKVVFPCLEMLHITGLDNIMKIWDDQVAADSFHKLKSLCVGECCRLVNIVPSSILGKVLSLESLTVEACHSLEVVFKFQPLNPPHGNPVAFSLLKKLKLNYLPELKCVWDKELHHHVKFQFLCSVKISQCKSLTSLFPTSVARDLVELTKLRIGKCETLTEVISDEGGREEHVVAFDQLKYIELDGLTELRCFSSGGCTLRFPLLEDVIVTECLNTKSFSEGPIEVPKLKRVQVSRDAVVEQFWKENLNITIQNMFEEKGTLAGVEFMRLFEFPELIDKWHSELNPIKSSWKLERLVVDKCPFTKALPSKLMLVLERMTSLQVYNCDSLEEIFDLEGLEAVESTQVLPQLDRLMLVNLPKLRQLWNKDLQGTMRFNSLGSLTLHKCGNLRHAFTPSMARCLATLEWMEIKECGQMEGVIAEEEGQESVVEKITFPNLEGINLECLDNLTSFLSGKNHSLDCPTMTNLTIAHCPKMRSLTWQSSMDIDHSTPSLFTPQVQFPKLRWLNLSHMDNLSKVWTDAPQETLTFDCLRGVEVQNCKSLENLFPRWVATSLTKLENLRVESCAIEEIVASGDDTPHSNTAQDLFSKLESLVLHDMPRLKSFCPDLPTLNWPFLEELQVTHCDEVNMLSFTAFLNKWTQRNDEQDLLDQEAHSSFERDFPNLKRLLLVDKDIQMVQDGKFPDDIFGKPNALTLACFHDEKAVFPLIFVLERFHYLESLEVFCSSFEDIFPDEGLVVEGKHSVLENLRELKLSKLHNLKHVWREDSLVAKILQSIETFEVRDCPCLTTIFLTMSSFRNLTKLVVKNSSRLVHLVTVSAVTNLVHLTDMTIIGCEGMKEVVANDENGEGKVISFKKLEYLTLQNLPSLESFSSTTSCGFRFPSLWSVEVEECPKMKIFSKGELSTPKLWWVTLFGYSWHRYGGWKVDLNTEIQRLSA